MPNSSSLGGNQAVPRALSPFAGLSVEAVNARHGGSPRQAPAIAAGRLCAAELGLLHRHHWPLSGHVLQMGSNGGPVSTALEHQARSLAQVDGPFSDLSTFENEEFDAIVAPRMSIDVVADEARRRLLDSLHHLLTTEGALIFSSHNLGSESRVRAPSRSLTINPIKFARRLVRLPRSLRHRAHLGPLQQRERGFAVLNDAERDYAFLHYFISRDAQECQLAEHGFRLLECVAPDGTNVEPGELGHPWRELHYVALAM